MKLSMTERVLHWVPMIPAGPGRESVVSIKHATLLQVRTYRAELRERIDRLNQTAVAIDYLLISASADAEDDVKLINHLRQQRPEEFDDE